MSSLALSVLALCLSVPYFAAPLEAQASRLVVLVRHAEAGGEPERDPPLTDRGTVRAEALAEALTDARIGAVVVSPLARTHLTAGPVMEASGLQPVIAGFDGGLDGHIARVAELVHAQPPGVAVLVAGHSNTIPRIITALGGPAMDDLCHGEFQNLFVMELRTGETPRLLRGVYGAADEEDPCA